MQAGCTQDEGDQLLREGEGGKGQSKNASPSICSCPLTILKRTLKVK